MVKDMKAVHSLPVMELEAREGLPNRLNRWSVGHSFLTVSAIAAVSLMKTNWPLYALLSLSFASFFAIGLRNLERKDMINGANLITAFRLGTVFLLPALAFRFSASFLPAAGLGLMLLDCLDGWLSRRSATTSLWGEFFDKETDSLFLLIICLVAFRQNITGGEILAIGLLRYFFVISIFILKGKPKNETRSLRARNIFTIVMLVLLFLFLPLEFPRFPLVALALFLTLFSFGKDFRKTAFGS